MEVERQCPLYCIKGPYWQEGKGTPYEHENDSFMFPFFIATYPHDCIVKLFSNMFLCHRRLKEDAAKINSFTRGFNLVVSASIGKLCKQMVWHHVNTGIWRFIHRKPQLNMSDLKSENSDSKGKDALLYWQLPQWTMMQCSHKTGCASS